MPSTLKNNSNKKPKIKLDEEKPLISIITVVYNGEKEIEETIQSVINQTYENIEYIILDGASKDGTVACIKKHEKNIDYWKSEKDKGIYDAMNKAIDLATGEWINFMNAGDRFAGNNVLEEIFDTENMENYDFIYGEHIWKGLDDKEHLVKTKPLSQMWQRISFCHQSLFTKTKLMQEKKFDLSYKIVCDYQHYFSSYNEGKLFHKVNFPISVFSAGGFSDINFFKRTKERYSVVKQYKNNLEMKKYYFNLVKTYYMNKVKQRIFNAK